MTPEEIKKQNLIKMGFTCSTCGLIYGIDHPQDPAWGVSIGGSVPIKDTCNNKDYRYYAFIAKKTARNYNLYKLKGRWFYVSGPVVDLFLQMAVVDEALAGSIRYPEPTYISRQVDLFMVAEELGIKPPLNEYQAKRAKTRAFIERIKK